MTPVLRLIRVVAFAMVAGSILAALAATGIRKRMPSIDDPTADEIRLLAAFGPLYFHSRSTALRGGTADCMFGGGAIDLRDAMLDPSGARLEVRAIFGGAQIVVPDNWIVTAVVPGVGGVQDLRPKVERAPDAPHLTIEGLAFFGGFTVTSNLAQETVDGLERAVAARTRFATA
jgi:hypothetical protein